MRTLLGVIALVLSLACVCGLALWAWQVAALVAVVAARGGVDAGWSMSGLGWALLAALLIGAMVFLSLGLMLIRSASARESDTSG